jgi:hypothetical protein
VPLRGVYTFDIDPDGNFARFQQQFAAHQDDMRAQHRQNATYGRGLGDYFRQFSSELNGLSRQSTSGAKDQKAAMESVSAEMRRAATFQGQFVSLTGRAAREMKEMARSTKDVASHIVSATGSLLKWSGIGAAIGSIVGPPLLAASVFNRQYAAGGLGITSGQQQGAALAYGRFFSADAALSNIATAKSDYSKRAVFSSLGISQADVDRLSPAQLLPIVAQKATEIFANSDRSVQSANAFKLTDIFSMEDLRRMLAQRDQMPEADRQYRRYSRDLNVSEADQTAWTNFYFTLRRAGDQIENSFVKGLARLATPLGDLTNAVTGAIDSFANSPELGKWIEELAGGVKDAAHYLVSEDFRKGLSDFGHNIGVVAQGLGHLAGFMANHPWIFGALAGGKVAGVPGAEAGIGLTEAATASSWAGTIGSWVLGLGGANPGGSIAGRQMGDAVANWWHGLPSGGPSAFELIPSAHAAPMNFASGTPGQPTPGDPRGMIPVLAQAALDNDVDPDDVVAIGHREGLGAQYASWDVNGLSYGALQMHQRGGGDSYKSSTGGGLANAFYAATGLDPSDPKNEAAMDAWAVHYGATKGWSPWTSVTHGRAIVPRRITEDQKAAFRQKYGLTDASAAADGWGGAWWKRLHGGARLPTLSSKFIFGTDTPPAGAGQPGFDFSGRESAKDFARVKATIADRAAQRRPLDPDPSPQASPLGSGSASLPPSTGGQVQITVHNATGGSAIVSSSQLAAGAQ